MYCLTEHLDYFNESVAGKHQLLTVDFDEIFKAPLAPAPLAPAPLAPAPVQVAISSPPPSPKSVMSMPAPLIPNPLKLSRDQAVASPTTVTCTVVFTERKEIASVAPVAAVVPVTPVVEKTKSRKRKIAEPATPSGTASTEDAKRERNRQHAKRSRQRKREYLSSLEQSMQELKAENEKLFQLLGLTPEDNSVVMEREAAMSNAANESFIEALKQPQNRVLSDDTLASLRELF